MAERSQYDEPVIDTAGNALANIQVSVYLETSPVLATLYSTRSGGGTISNPITTGITGLVSFFADPGVYRLELHDTEVPERISDRTIYWDSVSGDDDGIPVSLIENFSLPYYFDTGQSTITAPATPTSLSGLSITPATGVYLAIMTVNYVPITFDDETAFSYRALTDLRKNSTTVDSSMTVKFVDASELSSSGGDAIATVPHIVTANGTDTFTVRSTLSFIGAGSGLVLATGKLILVGIG